MKPLRYCSVVLSLSAVLLVSPIANGRTRQQGDHCVLPKLTKEQQDLLDRYQILDKQVANLPDFFLLSPKLGQSCEVRRAAAHWLQYEIGGHPKDEDQRFAGSHRAFINRVVLRVWPALAASPAAPNDGEFDWEKWDVLDDPIISDNTVTKLVWDDIRKNGLWGSDAAVIFSRSLRGTYPLIRRIPDDPKSHIIEKLYAIALMTRMKPSVPIPPLDSVTRNVQLTKAQAATVENLKKRIQAGQQAEWSDMDELIEDEI